MTRCQRAMQCRRGTGLNRNELDPALKPGSDAPYQPTTANADEKRVHLRTLLFGFETHGSLAEESFGLIEGVDLHCAGFAGKLPAGGQSVGVQLTHYPQPRTQAANPLLLRGSGHLGHED